MLDIVSVTKRVQRRAKQKRTHTRNKSPKTTTAQNKKAQNKIYTDQITIELERIIVLYLGNLRPVAVATGQDYPVAVATGG